MSERWNWWNSLWQRRGIARGDLAGGLTCALVLPAIEGSYGLVAFSPLGPEFASIGFLLGAFTAAVATFVSMLFGGRGPLISGSSAALALLLGSMLTWLMADPNFRGADGRPFLPMLLAFSALGLVLAGALQAAVARLKLGGLVRYVPYPVHAGYMNGTAVLMFGAMLPFLLGLPSGAGAADWRQMQPLALAVAVAALWVAMRAPMWTRRVPPYLTGLLVATALHHLLAMTPMAGSLGPLFDPPKFSWPTFDVISPVAAHLGDHLLLDKLGVLLLFAAAVAMMSSLQTALAGSTIDELTHKRRDGERELLAQGMSNVAVGLIGALPSAGSTMRSKINIDAGGSTAMSRVVFGVALLFALAFGLQFMSLVPMAAFAGVFMAVAFSLIDDWTRRATGVLWTQSRKRNIPLAVAESYVVMLFVAGVTVFVSLALAIALGTLVAMILFIRSNCKPPIRQVVHSDRRRSRKVRPTEDDERLHAHCRRIALVELDGSLFFGTAETADEEIARLTDDSEYIVLDFERVKEVDSSGARVLVHAAASVAHAGKHLLLSGLSARDSRTRIIRDMDVHGRLTDRQFFPDADRALEHVEDRLLASLAPPGTAPDAPLQLGQTLLGAGLRADEIELLASLMIERRYAKGEAVFHRGDASEALCVSLQGQIGIWLPAEGEGGVGLGRRMVSFAPGVVFGEMGLLHSQVRSADAIAEQDALVLELPRVNYDKIAAEHPVLLGKLLLNMGLLLASRVRALTNELEAAQSVR